MPLVDKAVSLNNLPPAAMASAVDGQSGRYPAGRLISLGSAAAPHFAPHFVPHFGPQRVAAGLHFERHFGAQPPAQADVSASAEVIAIADRRDRFFMGYPLIFRRIWHRTCSGLHSEHRIC